MQNFDEICNPVNNEENVDLIPDNNNIDDEQQHTMCYLFECKNISRVVIHVFVHITLLSLLEPLFYFLYVINIEKNLFFNQIKILINKIVTQMNSEAINTILSNPIVYYTITTTFGNNTSLDNYFSDLKNDYENSIDENNKLKNNLEHKAYMFSLISGSCTIVYFVFHQVIYKEKYLFLKIMLEHIILVLFIGFYEYWFFNNIILHYSPWTDAEITYYVITCSWKKAMKKIPALGLFVKNETSCKL